MLGLVTVDVGIIYEYTRDGETAVPIVVERSMVVDFYVLDGLPPGLATVGWPQIRHNTNTMFRDALRRMADPACTVFTAPYHGTARVGALCPTPKGGEAGSNRDADILGGEYPGESPFSRHDGANPDDPAPLPPLTREELLELIRSWAGPTMGGAQVEEKLLDAMADSPGLWRQLQKFMPPADLPPLHVRLPAGTPRSLHGINRRVPRRLLKEYRAWVKLNIERGVLKVLAGDAYSAKNIDVWVGGVVCVEYPATKTTPYKVRFAWDGRALNRAAALHPDSRPSVLPSMASLAARAPSIGCASTADADAWYYQGSVDESSWHYFGLRDADGNLMVMTRPPMGFISSGALLQEGAQLIFARVQGNGIHSTLDVYVDDFLCNTPRLDGESDLDLGLRHVEFLGRWFKQMEKAGVLLNPRKCRFARSTAHICGMILSQDGMCVNPERLAGYATLLTPTSTNCPGWLGRFIASTQYFIHPSSGSPKEWRQSIDDRRLLNDLLNSSPTERDYTPAHQAAAARLHGIVMRGGAVAVFRPDRTLHVHVDAADGGCNYTLIQFQDNGTPGIIYSWTAKFNKVNATYSVGLREFKSVIEAARRHHTWFRNATRTLIITDHVNNLAATDGYTAKEQSLMARWAMELSGFPRVFMAHRDGYLNVVADASSRGEGPVLDTGSVTSVADAERIADLTESERVQMFEEHRKATAFASRGWLSADTTRIRIGALTRSGRGAGAGISPSTHPSASAPTDPTNARTRSLERAKRQLDGLPNGPYYGGAPVRLTREQRNLQEHLGEYKGTYWGWQPNANARPRAASKTAKERLSTARGKRAHQPAELDAVTQSLLAMHEYCLALEAISTGPGRLGKLAQRVADIGEALA